MRRLLLFIALTGCGANAGVAPETPQAPVIMEVATGQPISFEALIDRLAVARVVYVGERHDRVDDHRAQRAILEALHARDPQLAIGFEMFQQPYQGALDAYVEGSIDEEELLRRTDWEHRWGFDFAMYRPLVAFGPEHRVPLVALNAPQEITRTIAREGLTGLDEATRRALPHLDETVAAHRARVAEALQGHEGMTEAMLERFYTAQLVWDETMAKNVASHLASHEGRMIVFAGVMHVARDAIPERAARRGAGPFAIVMPEDELPEAPPADFVWLTLGEEAHPVVRFLYDRR